MRGHENDQSQVACKKKRDQTAHKGMVCGRPNKEGNFFFFFFLACGRYDLRAPWRTSAVEWLRVERLSVSRKK